jgi:hypothetical protein
VPRTPRPSLAARVPIGRADRIPSTPPPGHTGPQPRGAQPPQLGHVRPADASARSVLVADRLETTRAGQLRLDMPGLGRRPYPTGQQTSCERCAAAGVARLGVSRAGPASPPLCVPCWRSDQDRQNRAARRRQVAQGWDEIADLDCPVCGPGPPDVGCWWCGDRAWLDGLRWVHERDQAEAAAAEAARVDAEFARIAEASAAESRVADLTASRDRFRDDVLARYRAGSGGRAVEHLADYLARDAAGRTSARGRPPVALTRVVAVLAVDADWRSGRRAMPGRDRAAELAGVSKRAVSDAYRAAAASPTPWAVRTCTGGRLSLERRRATGRANDRASFDLSPLSRSPIAPDVRAGYVPQALAILGQLLDRAQQLLDEALAELDALRTADPPDWAEHARRAHSRQDTRRALAEITPAVAPPRLDPNICTPHPVAKGECVSSCPYRGLLFTHSTVIHSRECPAGPAGGRRETGAPRSPTKGARWPGHAAPGVLPGQARALAQRRPAGPFRAWDGSAAPRRRVRPSWASWAYDLARELIPAVPWLADAAWLPGPDGRNRLLPCVAATLGRRLGPAWPAPAVLALLPDEVDAVDPLAVLAASLDRALTGDQAPPYPARRYDEYRRARAAVAHAAESARLAATLAELDAHAAGSTGAGLAVFRAARAQMVTATAGEAWPAVTPPGGGLPERWQHGADRHDQAETGHAAEPPPGAAMNRHTWLHRTEGDQP